MHVAPMLDLADFANAVGDLEAGPVAIAGLGTRGAALTGVRTVRAPSGIVDVQADEMTMTCGAGTPIDEVLGTLADVGQTIAMPPGGTIGGALGTASSVISRLGHGPVRDVLLRARYVGADGQVVSAGGPTVKNVSGFDVCRLLVGSWGTLGFLGEVILRTRPLPQHAQWFTTEEPPMQVRRRLYRPAAVLWNGVRTWTLLEGHPADVAAQATGLSACDAPRLPVGSRWSVPVQRCVDEDVLPPAPFSYIVEVGVGVVHTDAPAPARAADPDLDAVHARVRQEFDPARRLNPGVLV